MKSFSFMWTDALGAEIDRRSKKAFPIECHQGSEDFRALVAAVNQGIDSHLEAIAFEEQAGTNGRRITSLWGGQNELV